MVRRHSTSPTDRLVTSLPNPGKQRERRSIVPDNNVPADAIYKVFHMGGGDSDDFYACDIISDILSNGQSSRLYVNLIKTNVYFSGIDAYVSGDRIRIIHFQWQTIRRYRHPSGRSGNRPGNRAFYKDEITVREVEKIIAKTEARISYSEIQLNKVKPNLALSEFWRRRPDQYRR